ncbi:hypothetical protein GWK47_048207 [Chionoecetes opilio]|uniref:Uncharacterized protein n=1 Tax=Chionoecetes opilio TaxID=41210 RepID=A0A8J5CUJ9_CHIOP|nr:hypothetical protein GWK47_048207 [Chionoecetes opilio]
MAESEGVSLVVEGFLGFPRSTRQPTWLPDNTGAQEPVHNCRAGKSRTLNSLFPPPPVSCNTQQNNSGDPNSFKLRRRMQRPTGSGIAHSLASKNLTRVLKLERAEGHQEVRASTRPMMSPITTRWKSSVSIVLIRNRGELF